MTEKTITSCIEKHIKDDALQSEHNLYNNKLISYKSLLIDNLKSLDTKDVSVVLIDAFAKIGFDLKITSLSRFITEKNWADKEPHFCSTIAGKVSGINGFNLPDNICKELSLNKRLANNDKQSYWSIFGKERHGFSDIFKFFSGCSTGSGNGSDSFQYGIRFKQSDFVTLDKEYREFVKLTMIKSEALARSKELLDKYNKDRVPVLLNADMPFINMNDGLEAANKQLDIILADIKTKVFRA